MNYQKVTIDIGKDSRPLAKADSEQGALNAAAARKALQRAFVWADTKKGQSYWSKVSLALKEIADATPACDSLSFLSTTQKAKLRELLK